MAASSQSHIGQDLNPFPIGSTPSAYEDIPLTTIFTPPSSCLSTITYDGIGLWQGGLLQTGDRNCYPESFSNIFNSQYTPGICPRGWTSVASPNGIGIIRQDDGTLAEQAFCCPSGYHHSSLNLLNVCASLFGTPLTNVYSTSTFGEGPIPMDPSLITVDPRDVEGNTVYADIIQIQWAETDSEVLRLMSETSSSSSSQAQLTPAQTAHRTIANVAQTIPPTSAPTSTQALENESLSAGAKAGIGIGAAVGAVALALLAYFLGRWRRQKPQNNGIEDGENTSKYQFAHKLPSPQEKFPSTGLAELPSVAAQELSDEVAQELSADGARSVLGSCNEDKAFSPAEGQDDRFVGEEQKAST